MDVSRVVSQSFLGVLDADDWTALAGHATRRIAKEGTELFREGQPNDEILLVLRGRVRLWRTTKNGQVLVLSHEGPGGVLGQMSALEEGSEHSVNATAEEETELLRVPSPRFRAVLERSPRAALKLATVLASRVRALSDEVAEMKFLSIAERLLRKLRARAKGRREIKLTHLVLAQEVGSTRENVSRVLELLEKKKIVKLGRGKIEILDHAKLEEESLE